MPDGSEVPDDPTIPDDSLVYRRITAEWYKVDPATGQHRLTSAAFSDLDGAMSITVGIDVEAGEHEPLDVVANHPGYGLVAISVGDLRRLGLGVVRSATDGELCHGDVHGNKTKGTKNKLRALAEQNWIRKPTVNETSSDEIADS